MTATELPPGYGAMLSQFLTGWQPGREYYFVQHFDVKSTNDVTHWSEHPVYNITELVSWLKALPPSDNYLTATRYVDEGERLRTPIYSRVWLDLDFRDDSEIEVFNRLTRLRWIQDELRDKDGRSPLVIIFTGRGFHLWFYLDEKVSLEVARRIRAIIEIVFQIKPDPKVPIEPHRQMRLPGFINGMTNTPLHSVWCTEQMSVGDVRRAAVSGQFRWDVVYPKPPNYFLKLDPGTTDLKMHSPSTTSGAYPSGKHEGVDLDAAENLLVRTLADQASELRREGKSVDQIAIQLRRTRSEVEALINRV